jgi:hypothetical protein
MKTVPYERQTFDNPNPIARVAHRTRFAKCKAIALRNIKRGEILLDYGCGQGRFLHELCNELGERFEAKQPTLLGYDPYMAAKFEGYEVVGDPALIQSQSVSLITCLETCEHLDEADTRTLVNFTRDKLAPRGKLLISVPVMIGPAIFLKELSRAILFRRRPDIGIKELFRAGLFGIVPSRAKNIRSSHKGYDWRVTRDLFSAFLTLEGVEFSPIPLLGWYGNSQALMLFKKD